MKIFSYEKKSIYEFLIFPKICFTTIKGFLGAEGVSLGTLKPSPMTQILMGAVQYSIKI